MKSKISILSLVMVVCISMLPNNVLANGEDNANSGNGNVGNALDDKGFYRPNEYMYKTSLYVALGDTVNETHALSGNWHMIGDKPLYIKPDTYYLPYDLMLGKYNKYDYNYGKDLEFELIGYNLKYGNVPPPPIISYGSLDEVKSYFGDLNTMHAILSEYATIEGVDKEDLISDIKFQIDGVWDYQDPKDILPNYNIILGEATSKVNWLIMYEPLCIVYLKPNENGYRQPTAFTATELALIQKKGFLDWFYGPEGQYIASYTHKNLPNSIVLEEDWVGLRAFQPTQ